MPQEDKSQASKKAPRTQIEDLLPPVQELTEEEASLAAGGLVVIRGTWESGSTRQANTCTANNDSDYGND